VLSKEVLTWSYSATVPAPVDAGGVVVVDEAEVVVVEVGATVVVAVVVGLLGPDPEQAEPVNRILWTSWA
jgi:hypothetical protein